MASIIESSASATHPVSDAAVTHPVSCSECQRRKQKCSRTWPCNHCTTRQVSHKCHFGTRKGSPPTDDSNEPPKSARKRKELDRDQFLGTGADELSPVDGLKALGYLQIDNDPKFASFQTPVKASWPISSGHEEAIRAIPPRIYCDALVQNYLSEGNYQYYALYPPRFMDDYKHWWETKAKRQNILPSFTCLLLRVCACSTQTLRPALRDKIESELGETAQELTDRYHKAAEKLTEEIPPGCGQLNLVQELFLTAVWFKYESRFVDSWHALTDAIRHAQEIGMHDESITEGISQFDREMRRRVWCILIVWDRFTSLMLSRPLIMNDGHCSAQLPQANLEFDPAYPSKPSPIMHIVLQAKLCRRVAGTLWSRVKIVTSDEASAAVESVEQWFSLLPPVYRLDPDTSMDEKYPHLKLQRIQMHCMGYTAILGVLKPYLTKTNDTTDATTAGSDYALLATAVDYGLLQMDLSQKLFDLYFPDWTKNFIVAFSPFDTATLLCSAILRDSYHDLPRRKDVISAIGHGLSLIKRLKSVTRVGNIAWNVLTALIPTLALTNDEKILIDPENDIFTTIERPAKRPTIFSIGKGTSSSDSSPEGVILTPDTNPTITEEQVPDFDWQFDPNQVLGTQLLSEMDLGLLEPVWDWETINFNFDPSLNMVTNTQMAGHGLS